MSNFILLQVLCLVFVAISLQQVHIQLLNKCAFTVWPVIWGQDSHSSDKGFVMESGKVVDIVVPLEWQGKIWARTHCYWNMTCGTGSYRVDRLTRSKIFQKMNASKDDHNLYGPITSANFIFNRAGSDYYYVSLEKGHNLPITIIPDNSTVSQNCQAAGDCSSTINIKCPSTLKYWYNGEVIGCQSACNQFHDERYCCTGAADNMFECNDRCWPTNYPGWFKKQCKKSLTYKYDSVNSIFSCSGAGHNTIYLVAFCG